MGRSQITVRQILKWADAHCESTGLWPRADARAPTPVAALSWRGVDNALRYGLRGLPGGSSLVRLLVERRGAHSRACRPRLRLSQVLAWADAHHRRTGRWPTETSGPVVGAPRETWFALDRALRAGVRGLPGDLSLARLLAQRRGVRNVQALPRLTTAQILVWADEHRRRKGDWPNSHSGAVAGAAGETWSGLSNALQQGRRGLPQGSSLARLLALRRQVRNPKAPPRLQLAQVLRWARAHRRRVGTWPDSNAGPVLEAAGETWRMIDRALRLGRRGLPAGSSLYRLVRGEAAGLSGNKGLARRMSRSLLPVRAARR